MPDKNKAVKKDSPFKKYDEAAEYNYYDSALREALKQKNPIMFDEFSRRKQELLDKGTFEKWSVQKAIPRGWQDKLTPDEIKGILGRLTPVEGQDPYERFMQLRKSPTLGGFDYGWMPREDFTDYSPRDLAIEKSMSLVDGSMYYKPEIVNGRLVRKTNIGLEGAMKDMLAKNR